ncbi:unnamed protein product [Adineta ricciae]|uniref:Uncharacterized protein n=1 Tax=Adineta ricciae TaxID=249248 RepID=A0A815TRA0_ADIRI|nr:unnamed protein product [Adineta ricciae]
MEISRQDTSESQQRNTTQHSLHQTSNSIGFYNVRYGDDDDDGTDDEQRRGASALFCCSQCKACMYGLLIGALLAGIALSVLLVLYLKPVSSEYSR